MKIHILIAIIIILSMSNNSFAAEVPCGYANLCPEANKCEVLRNSYKSDANLFEYVVREDESLIVRTSCELVEGLQMYNGTIILPDL